jgi:uncharacterized membrane protein YkvA (DUF1232 family)
VTVTALIIGFGTAMFAAIAALLLATLIAAPRDMRTADLLRVYPDLIRLLAGLAKDKRVAWPVRWRLLAALAYNAQPINLIPDFIPVVGLADNVIITAWAIRSAIRRSGTEIVLRHWRGRSASFVLVCRLCRLAPVDEPMALSDGAPSAMCVPEGPDLEVSAGLPGRKGYPADQAGAAGCDRIRVS